MENIRKDLSRWWTYQQERFPIFAHGILIAAFSFSAFSYSSLLRGRYGAPPPAGAVVAFASSLLFFLQLRIADEFKDFEEDSQYRPYRPVPRGLIRLGELRVLGMLAGLAQLALAAWLSPRLVLLLAPVWLFLGLMSKEFFLRDWLKARPFTYMWTHMLIMPLIDFYVTSCDWLAAGVPPPAGLAPFLVMSFFNGMVLEMGRKIRAPGDEETGVETYSFLWGRKNAVLGWLAALFLNALVAWRAAAAIHFALPLFMLLALLLVGAALAAWRFLKQPITRNASRLELISGLWTIFLYLGVGTLPRVLHGVL